MSIIHICESATIRVIKEALCHQSQWPISVWYKITFHRDLMGVIGNQSTWVNAEQLKMKVAAKDGASLYHVHTSVENANILSHVRAVTDRPIVWDMHDWPDIPPQELLEFCDAVIVPSNGYKEKLDKITDKPVQVVYSMVPRDMLPQPTKEGPLINAGVLISGIGAPNGKHIWRDYTEMQRRIKHRIFVYPGNDNMEMHAHYDNILLVSPYMRMLQNVMQYSFGYAGAANSGHSIHDCVTNKFWEYIAAGIPVVTYRSGNMSELLKQWWGIALDDLAHEFPFEMWQAHRPAMLERRYDFTMETQTETIRKLYEEVMS